MLFKTKAKGIESFDPEKCIIEQNKSQEFKNDEIAMGCNGNCYSGCDGTCRRFQH